MHTAGDSGAIEHLLRDTGGGANGGNFAARLPLKAPRVLAMSSSALELMEAGIVGLEARRADRTGKIRLSIGEEEVKLAFKDDAEVRGLGF
jgi:origin recognition complex subunit 1